jgi:cell division protein FtsA
LPDLEISKRQLCHIMYLRVAETMSIIRAELEKQDLLDYLGAGVFITGGCARLRGLEQLAGEIFNLPVHIGHSRAVNGPTSAIESPEYSTAIGLVRYALGSQRDQHKAPTLSGRAVQTFQQLVQRIRALFV